MQFHRNVMAESFRATPEKGAAKEEKPIASLQG